VGESVRPHFEAILAAPHTLVPDALETNPQPAAVVSGVSDQGLLLSDGTRTVGVFPAQGQDHAAGYVLTHVSGEDLVFDSGDLFSPPAQTVTPGSLPAPLRDTLTQFGLTVAAVAGGHGSLSPVQEPDAIPLPTGFRPEGVAIAGGSLFVGSIPTGRVFRADVATGQGQILVEPPPGRSAIGLKVDSRGRLFVAGGATGQAYVYDAATGAELAVYTLAAAAPRFINDVIVTPQAAWFTDSRNPVLYRVPINADGSLAAQEAVTSLALSGDFQFVDGVNNANGIAATADGATLIIVQSSTGKLFTVNPATGGTQEILLGTETVTNGDGILLEGQTLFVVQNRLNQVAVVSLAADLSAGTVVQRLKSLAFHVPTTVAASDGSLYLPNARFGIAGPDTAEYSVVRIDKP
jgi:sugar lactone lactonase YvrE